MDKNERILRAMLIEEPTERWPVLAKAMAWERDTSGPPWMDASERDWFWTVIDDETAKAEKRAEQDAAWKQAKADLSAPFLRVVDWLARKLN